MLVCFLFNFATAITIGKRIHTSIQKSVYYGLVCIKKYWLSYCLDLRFLNYQITFFFFRKFNISQEVTYAILISDPID